MLTNVILVYIITQLISTAYGLAVIGSVKPLVEERLRDKGYVLKNKNSLYKFNEGLGDFFRGFIPFYYATKAILLVRGKNPIERAVNQEIRDGEYITREEQLQIFQDEEARKNMITPVLEPAIVFEKPERYTARRNDYTLYDAYETPIEYITREATRDNELEITPFANAPVVEKEFVKEPVTNSDIAKAISELEPEQLEALESKIKTLSLLKRNRSGLYKEAA